MGELVHRVDGVIVAKRWWASWIPQVVGWLGARGSALVGEWGGGVIEVRGGGLVHRGGGVIGAQWWCVGWSPGMVRWLGPRGGGDLQVVLLKKECSFSGCDM